MADDNDNNNTDPPAVRVINARGMAIQLVLAQLTELAGLGLLTWLRSTNSLAPDIFSMLFGGLLTGTVVGRIRGKAPVPLTSMLVTVAPALAKGGAAAAAARSMFVGLLAVVLGGCGLFGGGGADMATVHAQALEANESLDGAARELNDAAPLISLLCSLRGEDSSECIVGRRGHELARLSLEVARETVRAYNDTGVSYEAVQRAVVQLRKDFDDVRSAAEQARGVIDGLDRQAARPGDGAVQAPAPEAQPAATAPSAGAAAPTAAAEGAP